MKDESAMVQLLEENNRLRDELDTVKNERDVGLVEAQKTIRVLYEFQMKMMDDIKRLREGYERLAQDKNPSASRAVIGRQAARAGMTMDEWLTHCQRKGINPMKMDRSLPNMSKGKLSADNPARDRFLAKYGREKAENEK